MRKDIYTEMTIDELTSEMVVEMRDGDQYLVVGDAFVGEDGWEKLENYNDDMTSQTYKDYDIVKIYKPDALFKLQPSCFQYLDEDDLTWARIPKFSEIIESYASEECEALEDASIFDEPFGNHLENYCLVKMADGSMNVYLEDFQTEKGEIDDVFMDIDSFLYIGLDGYDDNLDCIVEREFDIVSIYRPFDITSELFMFIEDRDCVSLEVKCCKDGYCENSEEDDSYEIDFSKGFSGSGTIEDITIGEGFTELLDATATAPTPKSLLEEGMVVTLENGSKHTVEVDSYGDLVLIDQDYDGLLNLDNYDEDLNRGVSLIGRFDEGLRVMRITKLVMEVNNLTMEQIVWKRD